MASRTTAVALALVLAGGTVTLPALAAPAAVTPTSLSTSVAPQGVTTRASVTSAGVPAGNQSSLEELSSTGRKVYMRTAYPLDGTGGGIFEHDRATLVTRRIMPEGEFLTLSGDDRRLAYNRAAVAQELPWPVRATFVRDLATGAETLASYLPDGRAATTDTRPLSLSPDGSLLIFRVSAYEPVKSDAYVRDLRAKVTTRLQGLEKAAFTRDGQYVVGRLSGGGDWVRQDLTGGSRTVVQAADPKSFEPAFSGDGSVAVWTDFRDAGSRQQLTIRDLSAGTTTRLPVPWEGDVSVTDVSRDGRVALLSVTELGPDTGGGRPLRPARLWRLDLATGVATPATVNDAGAHSPDLNNYAGATGRMSDDASVVAFWSYRLDDLVPGGKGVGGVYVRDHAVAAADTPLMTQVTATGSSLSVNWDAPRAPRQPVERYRVEIVPEGSVVRPLTTVGQGSSFATASALPTTLPMSVSVQSGMPGGLGLRSAKAVLPTVSAPASAPLRSYVTLTVNGGSYAKGRSVQLWRKPAGSSTWTYVHSRTGTGTTQQMTGYLPSSVQWDVRVAVPGVPVGGRRVSTVGK
ncbi:MAG: hypothetical protein LWW86_14940 [Micrococcales bacterium]|nr:hypothetical protein [Micrococcales bacterium]